MKTINSFRSKFFALVLALMASVSIQAHDFSVDGIYYNILDGNNVEVTFKGSHVNQYVNEYINSINIPNEVTINNTTYTVTRVGDGAFYACRTLNSVTIPNSVTYIGDTAFYSCDDLTTVDVGNAVTRIGDGAFFRCSFLSSITIPNSVTRIGNRAFKYCYSMTSVNIGSSVTEIGEEAFDGCTILNSVTIPNSVINIGAMAFQGCTYMTSVVIGNNVANIGNEAFRWCYSLTSVKCHNTTPPILGENIFEWGSLEMGPYQLDTLYVPAESLNLYKEAEQWNLFNSILPIKETSYKSQWCDTWNMLVRTGSIYPPSSTPYRYQLAKDTVIGEHTYTAVVLLETKYFLDVPHYVAAVRFTDDRKVYIYYDNAEYLLYDFNVQEGEELEVFAGINNYTSEIKTYKCTVTGVEQYACVGCPAAITLEVHNHPNDFREFYRETQWIEGVGDINGFLNGINHYVEMDGGGSEYLLCAYKGDELKYTGDLYEEYGCGDDAEQTPEDLFPTLWGLQRTSCTKTIGEDEYGTVWGSRSYLMQETQTTTIDGKQYMVFGDEYDRFALREENNKILVYSSILKKDLVLYDFTLEVGDSLPALYYELRAHNAMQQWLYNGDIVDYNKDDDGTILPAETFVVTDISTITLLDGKEYKKWTFDNGMEYVEGIGSFGTSYAWNDFYQLIANGPLYSDVFSQYLVCVSKNNKLLYKMDDAEMEQLETECLCEYNDGPKKDNAKDGKIGGRPTPTQWNMLEMVVREMENNKTILQAETFSYTLEDNSRILNNKTYFDLARQSTRDTAITKSVVGALHFSEDEGNRVYFLCDGMEYLLYDFTVELGDTLDIFAGINNYPQATTYTHVVTGKDTLENGACRMVLEVVFPNQTSGHDLQKVWLAGLGSIDGIVHNAATRATKARSSETQTSVMLCAWRDDNCLYTTNHPEYDTFGCVYNQDPTAVEDVETLGTQYQKILRDGHLYILRDNKLYDVLGTPMIMSWEWKWENNHSNYQK